MILSFVVGIVMVLIVPGLYGGHGNENFVTEFLLVCLPVVILSVPKNDFYHWAVVISVVVAVGYLLFFNGSRIEYAVLAGVVFVLLWKRGLAGRFLAVVGGFFAFLVVIQGLDPSIVVRADLWANTLRMISASPVWGGGLGSFDCLYDAYRNANAGILPYLAASSPTLYAGAAHNEYLQIWQETGLVGLALAGAFVFSCVRGTNKTPELWCLFVIGVISLIEFPLQNTATSIVAAACLGRASMRGAKLVRGRSVLLPVAGVAFLLVFLGTKQLLADVHFSGVRGNLTGNPALAFSENARAAQSYPYDKRYRIQLALSFGAVLNAQMNGELRLEISEEAADKIFEIAESASSCHPGILLHKAAYLLDGPRWEEARAPIELLTEMHGNLPEAWLAAAMLGLRRNDARQVVFAVRRGLALSPRQEIVSQFEVIASHLVLENAK